VFDSREAHQFFRLKTGTYKSVVFLTVAKTGFCCKFAALDLKGVQQMASIIRRGPHQFQVMVRRKGFPVEMKTFERYDHAQAWGRSVEAGMDRGDFVSRKEADATTLHEALERYMSEIVPLKSSPYQERQRVLRWQKEPLAKRFLSNLRGVDFAGYRDRRKKDGRADNTIRLELALVGHVFEICRKEWGMEGLMNPLKNIRKPGGGRCRDRRLVVGEYEKLKEGLRGCGTKWAVYAFDLAIETSLRMGMLVSLRWEWLDRNEKMFRIPAKFRDTSNKGVPAVLPLSSQAVAVLDGMPRSIDGRVLPLTTNALRLAFREVCAGAEIKGLRWHDLRHEAASRLFEKGLNPFEVASITGHKSLQMLKRYTHLQPSDLVAKLG
jgi:integrase